MAKGSRLKLSQSIIESIIHQKYLMLDFLGVELHPRVLGVDVKQWTNCRVGMLGWALLTIVYFVAGLQVVH